MKMGALINFNFYIKCRQRYTVISLTTVRGPYRYVCFFFVSLINTYIYIYTDLNTRKSIFGVGKGSLADQHLYYCLLESIIYLNLQYFIWGFSKLHFSFTFGKNFINILKLSAKMHEIGKIKDSFGFNVNDSHIRL